MRMWFAIVALVLGLVLAVKPVAYAHAYPLMHATHTQLDQDVEEATPAAIAVCCPVPDLPTAGAVEYRVSIAMISWCRPAEIERRGQALAPDPQPPRV